MLSKSLKNEIIRLLKPHHPYKIILFGSHARGDVHEHSDIDLLVVLDSDFFPKTFREKMDIYLPISKALSSLKNDISIDLMVYTKPMYKKFLELDSMFSREILKNGIVLYEADFSRVA